MGEPQQEPDAFRFQRKSPFEQAFNSEAKIALEELLGKTAEKVVGQNQKTKHWTNVCVLVLGVSVMGGLAFLFRQNAFLASIPLVGIVVILLLWPVFEKFRTLLRFSAEFEPQKIAIHASSTKDDDLVRLQAELNLKKTELEIAEIDHRRRLLEKTEPNQLDVPTS